MASHAHNHDIPSRVSTPFKRASKVRVPGRGRFTSVMMALAVIGLIFAAGFLVVFIYTQTTEDAPHRATQAEQGEIIRPMVDLTN